MIIRAAKDDVWYIKKLCESFHKEFFRDKLTLNDIHLTFQIEHFIDNGIIFFDDGGLIAGMCSPSFFGVDKILMEAVWYVEPNKRDRFMSFALLDKFIEHGSEIKATHIMLTSIENKYASFLDRNFRSRDFEKLETNYIKDLRK